MKKFFSLLLALATIGSASASVILHESFDREVMTGRLSTGDIDNIGDDVTNWWCYSGTSSYIALAAGSLSYEGYVSEGKGNKAYLMGDGADDLRRFGAITSGKVYAAAIVNVSKLNTSTSGFGTSDFFTLGNGIDGSGRWCRLHGESMKEGDNYVGYKLGIEKYGEATAWAKDTLAINQNVLVVLEYEFVAGDNNDIVRLYINPTAKTKVEDAAATCDATKAATKKDAERIAALYLVKSKKTPSEVYVDEIKVATAWADLFEAQETVKAEIETGDLVFAEDFFYANETYTTTWNISGKNLTADITLTCDDENISFTPSVVKKEDAEAEGGAMVTVTFAAQSATDEDDSGMRTITLTSGATTDTYTLYGMRVYVYVEIPEYANFAAAFAAAEESAEKYCEGYYKGNAIITYVSTGQWGGLIYTLEDETGAIEMTPYFETEDVFEIGNALSAFYLSVETSSGIPECYGMGEVTVDANPEKTITPAEVTLAALLADTENKYLNHLVVVKNVLFDDTEVLLGSGNTPITQGETVANINLPIGNPLIDTAKPTKAVDITGVWAAGTMGAKYLRPRTAADIVDHTATGIEAATFDAETEIYTIQGMRVESLQPGVNIIRKGNTVYKVVR